MSSVRLHSSNFTMREYSSDNAVLLSDVQLEGKHIGNHVYTNIVILSCTLIAGLWLQFGPALPRWQPRPRYWRPFSENSLSSKPLAVIDFHSSGASLDRTKLYIADMLNHPRIQKGQLSVEVVVAKSAFSGDKDHFVGLDCDDTRNGEAGLVCRVEKGYFRFLSKFPNCGWYFKAMDDTWIDPERFWTYVKELSKVYDPFRHLVLIGHANHERLVQFYLHGGSGWIISRALIEYQQRHNLSLIQLLKNSRYQQDDTAQTIIVRHLFEKPKFWDEMLISGFDYVDGNWDILPQCPPLEVCAPVNKIIAQHTFGHREEMKKLVEKIKNASYDGMFYRDDEKQKIHLCRKTFTTSLWEVSYDKTPRIKESDVASETVENIKKWIDDMT